MILSFLGPSEWHAHSSSDYEIAPAGDTRRRRSSKQDDSCTNGREMVSFIQPNEIAETDDNIHKDRH